MTFNETTNNRPSEYSKWHRELGNEYTAIDIDYVEIRNGKIRALICTTYCYSRQHIHLNKDVIFKRTEFERKIVIDMALKLGVPAYYVIHSIDMKDFLVVDLLKETNEEMNEAEYVKFIKEL